MRKEITDEIINDLDMNNMKALEITKSISILSLASCEEIMCEGVDVTMLVDVVNDLLKKNDSIINDVR